MPYVELHARSAFSFLEGASLPEALAAAAAEASMPALALLDRHQVCCSAGSACRTGSVEASHVLRAMKLDAERIRGSMRFSFGRFNTETEVDKALDVVPEVISKLRRLSSASPIRQPAGV